MKTAQLLSIYGVALIGSIPEFSPEFSEENTAQYHRMKHPTDKRLRFQGRNRNSPCSCGSGKKQKKCCGQT